MRSWIVSRKENELSGAVVCSLPRFRNGDLLVSEGGGLDLARDLRSVSRRTVALTCSDLGAFLVENGCENVSWRDFLIVDATAGFRRRGAVASFRRLSSLSRLRSDAYPPWASFSEFSFTFA